MCCFAQPVESVSNTKIFARLASGRTQQLAYQMEYRSRTKNAMVLPIPLASSQEDAVRFIDLKEYGDFFRDLRRAFPPIPFPPMARSNSPSRGGAIDSKLVVHQVGNFVASVVPAIKDFERLDPQFRIPAATWEKIPLYQDFGFVVFQFEKLVGKPHPMAFEFESRLDDQVFFPTVHIHDGKVHETEDFDHELYCQHGSLDEAVGEYTYRIDSKTGMVRSKGEAGKYVDVDRAKGLIDPTLLLHRKTLKGNLKNEDTFVRTSAQGLGLSYGLPAGRAWPRVGAMLALSALPLAWILGRRQQISSTTASRLDMAKSKFGNK